MLSHPVTIEALVSHYLTNKLIVSDSYPRAESHHLIRRCYPVLLPVSRGYPGLEGTYLRVTLPFAAFRHCPPKLSKLIGFSCDLHA